MAGDGGEPPTQARPTSPLWTPSSGRDSRQGPIGTLGSLSVVDEPGLTRACPFSRRQPQACPLVGEGWGQGHGVQPVQGLAP